MTTNAAIAKARAREAAWEEYRARVKVQGVAPIEEHAFLRGWDAGFECNEPSGAPLSERYGYATKILAENDGLRRLLDDLARGQGLASPDSVAMHHTLVNALANAYMAGAARSYAQPEVTP